MYWHRLRQLTISKLKNYRVCPKLNTGYGLTRKIHLILEGTRLSLLVAPTRNASIKGAWTPTRECM
jgi:hypothetical protein